MLPKAVIDPGVSASSDDAFDTGHVAHGVLAVYADAVALDIKARSPEGRNAGIVTMCDAIPSRSITIKAASTVMKERMSKDADLLDAKKRAPVTRTSVSEPTARSWGPWNKNLEAVFFASQKERCFRKTRETCVFRQKVKLLRSCVVDFSELGVLLLGSCVLPFSPPPLPLFSPRFRNSFWSIPPRFVERNMSK